MENNSFSTTITVDHSPAEVFDAIINVHDWWSRDFKGRSKNVGDEFEVRFGDVHYSKHRLKEVISGERILWLTIDSELNFIKNKNEWNGTEISFVINRLEDKTHLRITHHGLVPEIECFVNCSAGWKQYLQHSLLLLITTGEGRPFTPLNDQ